MADAAEVKKPITTCKIRSKGEALPYQKIQGILTLLHNGYSKNRIAKELHVSRETVRKYIALKGSTPQARASVAVAPTATDGSDYNIQKSLGASLGLVNIAKNHYLKLALDGAFPPVASPLAIKQLVEAERMILTLPQDLNKGRRDLYEQINGRALEAGDSEVKELAGAGEMGA